MTGILYTWNAGNSGSFADPSNWYNQTDAEPATTPPGPGDDATFSAGSATVSGSGSVQNLTVWGITVAWTASVTAQYVESAGNWSVTGGAVTSTGNLSQTGTLTVSDGTVSANYLENKGNLQVSGGSVSINGFASNDGTIAVSGDGSFSTTGALLTGDSGSGTLSVSDGVTVSTGSFGALGSQSGGDGTATVDGSGSTWSLSTALLIGDAGSGHLTVSSGAHVVSNGFAAIGAQDKSSGDATVTGSGSLLQIATSLNVGGGGSGQLIIGDSGTVTVGSFASIGSQTTGQGTVEASGNGASLKVTGGLSVGDGGKGQLSIASGAQVTGSSFGAIGQQSGGDGTIEVSGNGSKLDIADGLVVGDAGKGQLSVFANGAVTVSGAATIGQQSTGNGTVEVSDDGSKLDITGGLVVGDAGTGRLSITSGGNVTAGSFASIGKQSTGDGTIQVSGDGSKLDVTDGLFVGEQGLGSLSIDSGGSVSATDVAIGAGSSGIGLAEISGSGSALAATGSIVANGGGSGSAFLSISNYGSVSAAWLQSTGANAFVSAMLGATLTLNGGPGGGGGAVAAVLDGNVEIITSTIDATGYVAIGVDGAGTVAIQNAGSLHTTSELVVGDQHAGSLSISGAGKVNAGGAVRIGDRIGGTGSLTVDGSGSKLDVTKALIAGNDGDGTLAITNGGSVSVGEAVIVGAGVVSLGTVTVDGAGSSLNIADALTVADGQGATGELIVRNSGSVRVGDFLTLGLQDFSKGTVALTGAGSKLDSFGALAMAVGNASRAELTIENGASLNVYSGAVDIGIGSSAQATIAVDGAGSSLFSLFSVTIGDQGDGTLSVENGASVTTGLFLTLANDLGSTGTATVGGSGSKVFVNKVMAIGRGGTGYLEISAGGSVYTGGFGQIGAEKGSDGTVVVTGAQSVWNVGDRITVGTAGKGTLTVSDKAQVTTSDYLAVGANLEGGSDPGDGTMRILSGGSVSSRTGLVGAFLAGSKGTVTVDGAGSSWRIAEFLSVGHAGTGTIAIGHGGTVDVATDLILAEPAKSKASFTVGDAGSWLKAGNVLTIGQGGTASLSITAGGSVTSDGAFIGDKAGAEGSVSISGAGAAWVNTGGLVIGQHGSAFVTVSSGGRLKQDGVKLTIGAESGSNGSLLLSNTGSLDFTGPITVGDAGTGLLQLGSGAHYTAGAAVTLGEKAGGSGTLTVAAANTVMLLSGPLVVGAAGSGTAAILSGATTTSNGDITLGEKVGSTGTLTLDGAGSTLTVGGALTIGAAGTGIGAVTGGASASVADDVTLAELAGSTGTLTLSGTGSALTAESGLTVGGGGSAGIKVQSGAQLSVGGDMTVGEQAGADGTVTVTAPGASLGVDGNLTLGAAGHGVMVLQGVTASVGGTAITLGEQVTGSGTLTLEGAALVFGGVLTVGGAGYGQMLLQQGALMTPDTIVIGEDTGSVGELHVDGALTSVTSHVLTVGSSGRGTLTVTNGAELVTNGDASVGELVSGVVSTATVDTGGTWSLLGGLTIGSGGKATMLVQGQGRVLAGGDIVLGEVGSGFGSLTVSGASVLGPAVTWHGTLAVGDAGTGLLTIQSGATVADAGGAGRIEIGAGAGTGTVTVTGAGSELRGTVVAVDHGLLQINAGGVVSVVDAEVHAGGTISLAGGSLLTDPVSVDADGNITGNGTITGAIATAGTITAAGGTLTLTDDVTGPGTLAIADNATLDLHGNAADTLTVHFAGGGSETLLLGLPLGMQASIDGFFKGDAILFGPYDTVFSEFAGDVLSVYSGGLLIASLHFIGSYTADDFNVVAQNGTVTVSTDVLCFLRGTQIATPDGAMPVEALREGDLVLTHAGDAKPVIWIGRGRVLATRGRRTAATPVVVRKNALAPNVPNHDLRVTKAHSLFLDGVLIPVEFLVNHRSICWDDHAQEVEIFHVELEQHDVLLANGTPAETYRDDGNRWLFQNANAAWHLPPKPPCAPVVTNGPIVDRVWRRILDRAGPRPGWPLTQDPDLHLMVDGQRLDGLALSPRHYVFTLPAGASHLRIVSRSAAPQQLGLNRDPRELGAAIARIVIAQDGHQRTIDACDPRLAEGFYGFEPEIGVRWTGGDALLPAALWRGFGAGAELQIWLNGRTFYPDEPARKAA